MAWQNRLNGRLRRRHVARAASARMQPGGPSDPSLASADARTAAAHDDASHDANDDALMLALFRSAPVPLAYTRSADRYRISHWNEAWFRAFGYAPEQVDGRSGPEFGLWVDPADRERYGEQVRQQGYVRSMQVRLRHADGDVHWYQVSGQVIGRKPQRMLITAFVDVTDQLRARQAIQAAQERLQAVFDASPVAMIVSDARRGFCAVAANAAWFRQFARKPEDVLGRNGVELGLWADTRQRDALFAGLRGEGDMVEGFEADLVRGDGGRMLTRLSARRFRAGDDDLMVTVQEDITERVRAEQALRESREMLSHTFDLLPEPLCIIDADDGRILEVNRRWVERIGYTRDQVVGRTTWELGLWRDARAREHIRALLHRDGRLHDVPVTYYLPSGEVVQCEVSASEMVIQGRRVGLWLTRDMSERVRTQAQLRELNESLEARVSERTRELRAALEDLQRAQNELVQAEKLASLGSLVAGVAHELNTPIGNAVMVASTMADDRREFEQAVAGGLRRSALEGFLARASEGEQVLERNLQRAAELVGSFKQLAVDQSSYQRRPFEVAEVAQEVLLALSPTLRRSGVHMVDSVPLGLPMDGYPGPLGQVLVNLITNAVEHGFEGRPPGTIRLHAQSAVAPGWVRLTVADDGVGIPESSLGRIFDPFFTTRLGQGGSGLGLHLAYTLVTGVLGGRIEVRSQSGEGSEFVIELPCRAPMSGAAGIP
ncbi:MAG: PAS domain S-box protein [Burkholderiaceae bacterium]|nr:PAS domain S-box protein [Burkholderiaceae bacterium]